MIKALCMSAWAQQREHEYCDLAYDVLYSLCSGSSGFNWLDRHNFVVA